MKKGDKYFFAWGILLVLVILSFYFDVFVIKEISLIRTSYLNEFFLGITFLSSEIIIFFILTSFFLVQEHKRKWILPLWITLGLSAIVSFLLKIGVQRMRPFQQGITTVMAELVNPNFITWNLSFPSFQSMMVFSAIPILNKEFPKMKYFWWIFAFLVGFSRIYFGLHFLSDVLVGGIIGYFIGLIIVDMENKKRFWSRIYERIFYGER